MSAAECNMMRLSFAFSFVSLYLFSSGSLQHDSSFYFSENFVTVNRKTDKITDSLHLRIDDPSLRKVSGPIG